MKKKFRIRQRKDFVRASNSGIYFAHGSVITQCVCNGLDFFRAGFTATKRVGNAVVRNRCKRRMRAAACELLAKFGLSGVDYVFIARKSTSEVRWEFLSEDMKSGIDSINKKMLKCEKSRYC